MNRQFSLIATAITFYTRIPLPGEMHSGGQQLNEATQWLPLIGVIVGAIAAATYAAIAVTVGTAVAAVGAMATGIALTGAFHEDGLADTADGVGGGWTMEQKLEIMKDSRVGSYGLITTVLVQLAVFASLVELYAAAGSVGVVVRALIVAHVVSRLAPVLVIAHGTYARADATSKVRPVSKGISRRGLAVATITAAVVAVVLRGLVGVGTVGVSLVVALVMRMWSARQIGGYTGDILGATQQVSFVAVLVWIVAWV